MKSKCLKILIIIVQLMIIMPIGKSKAFMDDVSGQIKDSISNLPKYEMVLVYPDGMEETVENTKNELIKLYETKPENLIITEEKYDINYCDVAILSRINLQGDNSFKSIVFVWTNTDMCEPIKDAIEHTSPNCRLWKAMVKQTVITIPTDEETASSLMQWKEDKDWCNYRYENDLEGALGETKEILGVKEEKAPATDQLGENKTQNQELPLISNSNDDLEIKNEVEGIKIVLADGTIMNPSIVDIGDKSKAIYMDEELMYGATVYIQSAITINAKNDEEIDLTGVDLHYDIGNMKYDASGNLLDTLGINSEQGWIMGSDGKLTIDNVDNVKLGQPIKVVTSQMITSQSEVNYKNIISGTISYTKHIVNEEGIEEDVSGTMTCNVETDNVAIIIQR